MKDKNLEVENIKEKFTIELIWNDLIYQKFIKKVIIDKEKIKNEILQNPPKEQFAEILLSEITVRIIKLNLMINMKKFFRYRKTRI